MQQQQEAHGCVHLKHTMDTIHFLINANSIQIIVDTIIHRYLPWFPLFCPAFVKFRMRVLTSIVRSFQLNVWS